MFSPAFAVQAIHALLGAFASVGFGVAGIHAWMLRRDPGNAFHQNAIHPGLTRIAMIIACHHRGIITHARVFSLLSRRNGGEGDGVLPIPPRTSQPHHPAIP